MRLALSARYCLKRTVVHHSRIRSDSSRSGKVLLGILVRYRLPGTSSVHREPAVQKCYRVRVAWNGVSLVGKCIINTCRVMCLKSPAPRTGRKPGIRMVSQQKYTCRGDYRSGRRALARDASRFPSASVRRQGTRGSSSSPPGSDGVPTPQHWAEVTPPFTSPQTAKQTPPSRDSYCPP